MVEAILVKGCFTCPMYSNKYCSAIQRLGNENPYAINEARSGVIPKQCPLRGGGIKVDLMEVEDG